MGHVTVTVGGRSYALSCADGEEAHLSALGAHLAAKADELTAQIGSMSEPRLLLMAGLQIADEWFALRAGGVPENDAAAPTADMAALLARIEALAARLEDSASHEA